MRETVVYRDTGTRLRIKQKGLLVPDKTVIRYVIEYLEEEETRAQESHKKIEWPDVVLMVRDAVEAYGGGAR